ncbi:hypothetical protein OOU_Y34scaffold00697g18 [Pyricularia oryzae Y34]|uniref:Uncharacterized protein n=1 Tax=Pyricularia oryzae (strain Y34) TaxID=1143189 RepID=A0AA97NSL1_PYRO3|nr:hypothetical protein OOU_Y34scaffold00697g18 [Pyricularia oryzae Y34]
MPGSVDVECVLDCAHIRQYFASIIGSFGLT